MRFVTDFADLAVALPLALCVAAVLGSAGWWRGVAAWGVAVGAMLAGVLTLKLLFLGCAAPTGPLFSPSGHTAVGGLLYGGMAAIWLRQRVDLWAAVGLGGVPAAVVIGITRLALHAHSVPEVGLGACVGLAGLAWMLGMAGLPPQGLRIGRVVLVALPIVVMLHGMRLPAEMSLRRFAGWMPASVCAVLPR